MSRPTLGASVLVVELTSGDLIGQGFLVDMVRMLDSKAKNMGATLEVVDRGDVACVSRLRADTAQLVALGREAGVHRAQLVPSGSTSGRVVTARVLVTIGPGGDLPMSASIVKTYHYPTRKVTVHATGESLDLEEVLAGLI
jgi:protein subunit release factor A